MVTDVLDQRRRFIDDLRSERWTMSELCARYGISRPTGYLWRARYQADGVAGLEARSSAPHTCPHETSPTIAAQIVAARRRYGWGAKKLRARLQVEAPNILWPARSTINDILDRHGLLRKSPTAARPGRIRGGWRWRPTARMMSGRPTSKGSSKRAMGWYCYPLDRHRSLQSAAAGVSRVAGDHGRGDARGVSRAVSRARPAAGDSHRQRRPLRRPGLAGSVGAQCVVDAAGDHAPAHSAGLSAGEWQP